MKIPSAVKVLLGAMLSVCAAANAASINTAASAGRAAAWQPYDILVHLTRLPRPYSCDELWYKFRAVLITLGAGRVDEVAPADCASTSPSIHVRFVLPRIEPGLSPPAGDIVAAMRTVELAPGSPEHLTAADCYLVREIRESLLTDLPVKVLMARFACGRDSASPPPGAATSSVAAGGRYILRVQSLLPLWPERPATTGSGS